MRYMFLAGLATAAATLLTACAHVTATPPEVRRMTVGTAELPYVDTGHGIPLVLVHGSGSDWRSWEALRPHWPAGWRHIAYTLRGHHPMDPAGAASTAAQHAVDLRNFVRGLGIGPVHVVGLSLGGRVAIEAALAEPALFRSVVSSDPLIARPVRPDELALITQMLQDFGKVTAAARAGDRAGAVRGLVAFTSGEADGLDHLPAERRQLFMDNAGAVVAMATTPLSPAPTCEGLGQLTVPILVLEGEKTRGGFRASNNRLMECLPPQARREILAGAPHSWQHVAPQPATEAIVRFIQARGR